MDAVGPSSEGYVGTRVDQESSSWFSVLSSELRENAYGFARKGLQFARGEIFFTELDVVDFCACRFGNLL